MVSYGMRLFIHAALLAGVFGLAPSYSDAQQQQVDVLIRGGTVVDGTGAAARRADVGIRGDRIAFIGDAAAARVAAGRVIDATGLIVAPGFVDPHTHAAGELSSERLKANLNYLTQGVTTVITNNDGGSPLDIGGQLAAWSTNGIGTNAAVYIGQGSVRRAVMGMSAAAPTPAQLDSMRRLVAKGMDDGAIGMSTGLFYAPGSYSTTEEVIELAKVAAAKGGRYDSHIRDESSYSIGLIGAVNEVIRIGRETRMPVHISHIKALGVDVWGQSDTVIALMKQARAQGIDVTGSQYPYTASGSSVGASLLPRWAETGGRDSLVWRFTDPPTRQRLVAEMNENMRRRGGANSLLITGGRDSTIRGKRLDEVARMWGTPPVEAAIRIIMNGGASTASFNMNEKDIVAFMQQDFISTDSDGSDGHPRKFGAFPKFFREYVAQKRVMSLPHAIRRSSAASAKMMGLADRGVLAPGHFADVIAFDPATFADKATYEQPTLLSEGMKYVLVNGVVAIDGGKYTGALAGRVLKRPSP
jgi:N-acyl-D-amino-acid deacylase